MGQKISEIFDVRNTSSNCSAQNLGGLKPSQPPLATGLLYSISSALLQTNTIVWLFMKYWKHAWTIWYFLACPSLGATWGGIFHPVIFDYFFCPRCIGKLGDRLIIEVFWKLVKTFHRFFLNYFFPLNFHFFSFFRSKSSDVRNVWCGAYCCGLSRSLPCNVQWIWRIAMSN